MTFKTEYFINVLQKDLWSERFKARSLAATTCAVVIVVAQMDTYKLLKFIFTVYHNVFNQKEIISGDLKSITYVMLAY